MMKRFAKLLSAGLLVGFTAVPAVATTQAELNPEYTTAVNCIYNALESDKKTDSIGVYRVDGRRAAVEFTFHDEKYGVIVADIMLHGLFRGNVAFDITLNNATPDPEREEKGFSSVQFVRDSVLTKCSLTPAFDSVVPPPSARSKWQQVSWPSPTPSL
jgi:hypothetical protein